MGVRRGEEDREDGGSDREGVSGVDGGAKGVERNEGESAGFTSSF